MPPTLVTSAVGLPVTLHLPVPYAAPEESVAEEVGGVVVPVLAVAAGAVAAYLFATILGVFVRRVARRSTIAADLTRRSRRPTRAVLLVLGVWIALVLSTEPAPWRSTVEHLLFILLIVAVAWLVGSLAFVLEDAALARYRVDVEDNRRARRVRTQVQLVRRITVAVLVVCAIAAILLTFPSARAFGASLLASAGLLSIVAGLAAQSSLANMFAGMQLAFTDAIRVDDVVVVDGEWGRIEEITLTYVVVHIWDDRRLILPSKHFTETPFENWTRRQADLLGTVELDLDWQVPVDAMRAELNRLLAATDLWDGRVGIVQVTDAIGGAVRVRVLASARDAPTLFDLRCYVREGLVGWLQREAPQGLPLTRWEARGPIPGESADAASPTTAPSSVATATPEASDRRGGDGHETARPEAGGRDRGRHDPERREVDDTLLLPTTAAADARLFTGSVEAVERSRSFQGPGPDAFAEREQNADEREQDTDAAGKQDTEADREERTGQDQRTQRVTGPAGESHGEHAEQ